MPRHDNVRLVTKVYIEGVQVPFESISISSSKRDLPSLNLQLPYMPGLVNISRYYSPKVHVFFRDFDAGEEREDINQEKATFKLLFSGVIVSSVFGKSTSSSGSGATMTFRCMHKNMQMESLSVSYLGWTPDKITRPEASDAISTDNSFNSMMSFIDAFKGVDSSKATGEGPSMNVHGVPDPIFSSSVNKDKYQGVPGIFMSYWNILKRSAFQVPAMSQSMTELYKPLLEDSHGLRFFHRMTGHTSLEKEVGSKRVDVAYQGTKEKVSLNAIIPPTLRETVSDAVAVYMAQIITQSNIGFSGESTTLLQKFDELASVMEYSKVTLTSPAKVGLTEINETILVPPIPFYYSPTCNVVLPNMYDTIQISEDTFLQPTRVVFKGSVDGRSFPLQYRGPHSVREAFASSKPNGTILDTFSMYNGTIADHEWGRGVLPLVVSIPQWFHYLKVDNEKPGMTNKEFSAAMSSVHNKIYGNDMNPAHNPYNSASGCTGYQQIILSALDLQYARALASSRSGYVQTIFNPYIVPGYPMDVISPDAISPSYHAMCDSVSHTIYASGRASTDISFSMAMPYEEMMSYYLPPVTPWMQKFFGMLGNPTIVNNESAAKIADSFYQSPFGVNAARPENIFDFASFKARHVTTGLVPTENTEDIFDKNQINLNLYNTATGSLSLVKREIESMLDYEVAFGVKFIDVTYDSFIPELTSTTKSMYAARVNDHLEMGYSLFLDYTRTAATATTSTANVDTTAPSTTTSGPSSRGHGSTDITTLRSDVRAAYIALREACAAQGITIRPTSCYRSVQHQNDLRGRLTTPVANGLSPHSYMDENGVPQALGFDINATYKGGDYGIPYGDITVISFWNKVGDIAKATSAVNSVLKWGGDFKTQYDPIHFQHKNSRELLATRFPQHSIGAGLIG